MNTRIGRLLSDTEDPTGKLRNANHRMEKPIETVLGTLIDEKSHSSTVESQKAANAVSRFRHCSRGKQVRDPTRIPE